MPARHSGFTVAVLIIACCAFSSDAAAASEEDNKVYYRYGMWLLLQLRWISGNAACPVRLSAGAIPPPTPPTYPSSIAVAVVAAGDLIPTSTPLGYTYVYGMRYCEILRFKNVPKDRLLTANVYSA